jgi:hypothetical protein
VPTPPSTAPTPSGKRASSSAISAKRAKANRAGRERQAGSQGPASACRRINPKTGEVIEIVEVTDQRLGEISTPPDRV